MSFMMVKGDTQTSDGGLSWNSDNVKPMTTHWAGGLNDCRKLVKGVADLLVGGIAVYCSYVKGGAAVSAGIWTDIRAWVRGVTEPSVGGIALSISYANGGTAQSGMGIVCLFNCVKRDTNWSARGITET